MRTLSLSIALLTMFACSEKEEIVTTHIKFNYEILVKSSAFRGINGVAWGPDNLIWMGSVWSGTLVAVDPETGEIRHTVEAANGPDDLAFHPDGRLFWNDIAYGEIGGRTPSLSFAL